MNRFRSLAILAFLACIPVAYALIGSESEVFVGNAYDSVNGYKVKGTTVIDSTGAITGAGGFTGNITGNVTGNVTGQVFGTTPTTQVIGAAGTIAADACGGIKRISSAAPVTTNTTNTFTAPAAANKGCVLNVCNVNAADAITLDNNVLFQSAAAGDVALAGLECVLVGSDGAVWRQLTAKQANHA